MIVNFLRANKGVSVLGVHGESIGGVVAAHVAWKCKLDFLFVDRCFSTLEDLVRLG